MRQGAIVAVSILLSGCAYPFAQRADPQTATLVRELPATEALVMPPPGGPAVLSVLERRYANAIEQSILLANDSAVPGENRIDAVFYGPADTQNVPADNRLKYDSTSVTDIQKEIRAAFPGIGMRISDFYAQNGYGPFGYAVGRGGGRSTCLYAWQRIEPPRNRFGEPAGAGAIKLRVRLCRANSSEEALLRFLYGYVISGYYLPRGWNPYGPVPPPPAHLGTIDAPMLPTPMGENPYYVDTRASRREGRVLPVEAPEAPPAPRRAATAPAQASAYPSALGAPGLTTVASPIDPPLGMPSALPDMPASGTATPAAAAPRTEATPKLTGAANPPRAAPAPTSTGGARPAVPVPAPATPPPSGASRSGTATPAAVPPPAGSGAALRPTTAGPSSSSTGGVAVPPAPALRGTTAEPSSPPVIVPPPAEP